VEYLADNKTMKSVSKYDKLTVSEGCELLSPRKRRIGVSDETRSIRQRQCRAQTREPDSRFNHANSLSISKQGISSVGLQFWTRPE
jgi:hypothetical protein